MAKMLVVDEQDGSHTELAGGRQQHGRRQWQRGGEAEKLERKLLEIALEATESGTKNSSTMKIAAPKKDKKRTNGIFF